MKFLKNVFINYKFLLSFFILILLLLLLLNKNHWQESASNFVQVTPADSQIDGKVVTAISDNSSKTSEICSKSGCELNFALDRQHIDKIFLSFDYNEAPDGVEIFGLRDGQSSLLDKFDKSEAVEDLSPYNPRFNYNEAAIGVRPYHSSYISGTFDQIKIKLLTPKEDRLLTINDIIFYQKHQVSAPRLIFNLLAVHQRSALAYIFYAILLSIIFFPPGFFIFDRFFERRKFSQLEKVFLAFGLTLIFWAAIGLIVTFLSPTFGLIFSSTAAALSIIYFFKSEFQLNIRISSKLVKLTILFAAFLLLYVFIFDGGLKNNSLYYKNDVYFDATQAYDIHPGGYAFDQMVPYGSAKILIYDLSKDSKAYSDLVGINILSNRTQLFSYLLVPFIKIFGDRFLIFEILGIISIILLPVSVWLLAIEMTADKRSSYLALFFTFTSPYLIYMFNVTQLKIISTILLTAYFYFIYKYKKAGKKSFIIAASVLATVAILIHNFSFIYVLAGIIFLGPNILNWFKKRKFIELLILLVPIAISLLWFIYSYFDSKSSLILRTTNASNIPAGLEYFRQKFGQRFNIISPFFNRYLNFLGFFIIDPAPMVAYRSEGLFRSTIYSLTSFVLFPFFIWSVIKFFREYAAIWLYLIILVILTLSSVGDYTYAFGMHLYLVAAIPLLMVIIARAISGLEQRYLMIICFLVLAEAIFINFIAEKNLSDLQFFLSQYPLYAFLTFLSIILLQISPLWFMLENERK